MRLPMTFKGFARETSSLATGIASVEIIEDLLYNLFFFSTFMAPGALALYSCYNFPMFSIPIVLAYYTSIALRELETTDGSPSEPFSRDFPIFTMKRRHHSLRLVRPPSGSLDPARMSEYLNSSKSASYVFACHPHGVAAQWRTWMEGLMYTTFPALARKRGWRTLAASVLFWMPLVREIVLWTGCVDASRKTAQLQLQKGRSLVILPGGEAEQLRTKFGQERVTLKNRMGFVALAVESGTPLVPVYVFGCSDLYYTFGPFFGFREAVRKVLRVCLPLFLGDFGLAPRRGVKVTVVFGDPIPVNRVKRPRHDAADEQKEHFRSVVQKVHRMYIERLAKLFDDAKADLGFEERKLVVE